MTSEPFRIWAGLHTSFREVPAAGDGFQSDKWIQLTRSRTSDFIAGGAGSIAQRGYLLPAVAAGLPGTDLRVLDFGGGAGTDFQVLRSTLPESRRLDYHVVDNADVCAVGRELFADDPRVQFHAELPAGFSPDIVHSGSTLQYVEDWRGLLAALLAYKPQRLLLSDVFAGDIEPFVAGQNVWGSVIPFQFLRLSDVIAAVEGLGFRLILRQPYQGPILGKPSAPPMDNFPVERRLACTWHLLFARD